MLRSQLDVKFGSQLLINFPFFSVGNLLAIINILKSSLSLHFYGLQRQSIQRNYASHMIDFQQKNVKALIISEYSQRLRFNFQMTMQVIRKNNLVPQTDVFSQSSKQMLEAYCPDQISIRRHHHMVTYRHIRCANKATKFHRSLVCDNHEK